MPRPTRRSACAPTAGYSLLADGVGGHDLGEVASHTAVESCSRISRSGRREKRTRLCWGGWCKRPIQESLKPARAGSPGGAAMATTIVACALRYDRVAVAHVGDSRCYLIRRGQASLLTRDHTVANEHVRLGILSADEAAKSATSIC